MKVFPTLLLLTVGAFAQPTQLLYNERGQTTGTASTTGNVTTFPDRSGP
jgi:YD repeat-containing protein